MTQYILSCLLLTLAACGGGGGGGGGGTSTPPTVSSGSSASSSNTTSSSSSASTSSVSSSSTSSSASSSIAAGPTGINSNTLCLNADGPAGASTYTLIENNFGTGAVESPSDGQYTPSRPHVIELNSDGVVGPHFGILAIDPTDVNLDFVTLANGGDRSRTEIKIAPSSGSHDAFKAHENETYIYAWRFKIASGMKFSTGFTHLHQIKAYVTTGTSPDYSDPPLITLTARVSSGNNILEVRQVNDLTTSSSVYATLGSVALSGLTGQWLDVREEITYANPNGRYKLSIKNQAGTEVLSIDQSSLQMWRTGANHMRPKWGIYRKHDTALNQNIDDYVYFANFGITRGSTPASTCR